MPHTGSRYMQTLGFNDGRMFLGPGDIVVTTTAGTATTTRNAAGDISVNLAVSTTAFFSGNLIQQAIRRTGFFEDLQEQFGGAGVPGEAQPQFYRPDVIGAMAALQQITPRTVKRLKGIKPLSVDCIYLVQGANASTLNLRSDSIVFSNGLAQVITPVLVNGTNGLNAAFTAGVTPYVINVPLPNQAYFTTFDAAYWVEMNVVTPGGGTFRFYGFDVLCEFNYN